MTELIPVVSDIQYPLHDKRAVSLAGQIIADIGNFSLCVGDELDNWQTSRWCRGRKGEYDGNLADARDGVQQILMDLNVAVVSRSNHGNTRLENYLEQHAPALAELPELSYEEFMGFNDLGIFFAREPYLAAPGWLMVHGDEGSLIKSPGGTALNIAKNWGFSIVCGHTHKMGIQHHHVSWGGKVRKELWGFEVGNLMDQTKAEYLKGGYGNWQQGMGVLVVDGKDVTPIPVPFRRGVAYFDGKRYKA